ncbi:MAG: MmgE/PrpD family protein [Actinobacteria bacterium]|nr:MmgE/PrpD family protein [Actinomycetota bacterium]
MTGTSVDGRDSSQAASVASRLARFSAGVSYDDLPASAVEFAKALILKIVAGEVGGSHTPSAQKLGSLVRDRSLPGEAGVVGQGYRTSLWDATLMNVFSGHCSELEDVAHSPGGVSWDISVIPLVLTMGERLHLSGKAVIEAVAAGLEVSYRTCLPFDSTPVGMVLPPTAAMGTAAAAAHAYGLDAELTESAMGFGLSSAGMAEVSMGTDAHFFESALHAYQALMGTEMARAGMSSNPDLTGFSGLIPKGMELDDAVAGLGEHWLFEEIWIKKHPLCFLVHRQTDAMAEICATEGLTADDIEDVEVYTGPGDASCDRPHPRTVGDMQFSFQHALGVAMLRGSVGLADLLPEAADDPEIERARQKVHVTIDESIPFNVSLAEPTKVTVKTRDGREIERELLLARGSPDQPLSKPEHEELYRRFATGPLSEAVVEDTMATIFSLETVDDIAELTEQLTYPDRRTA